MTSRFGLACLGAVVASGCFVEFKEGGPCASTEECPTGQTCQAGVCRLGAASGGGMAGGAVAGGAAAGGAAAGGSAGGAVAGGAVAGGSAGGAVAGGAALAGGTAGGVGGGSIGGGDAGGVAGGAGGGDAGGTAGGAAGGVAGGTAGGAAGGATGGGSADGGALDGGAQLDVDRSSIMFGSITSGSTSAATTVVVTNVGAQPTGPVMASISGAASSSFQVQTSTCSGALGPLATCQVSVIFSPTTTGPLAAQLDISGMPGGTRAVALTGQGAFPAALSITPMTFDFRGVGLGSSSMPTTFTVTNTGGSPTGAPSVAVTGPDGAMFTQSGTTCGAALAPAGTCTVTLVFVPTTTGPRSATLEVRASPGGQASATLSANGQTPAALSATPSPGVFTDTVSGGSGDTIFFDITNSGQTSTAPLAVGITGTEAADFVRGLDTCQGSTLAGSGSCTVRVQFNPRATGTRNALLSVSAMGAVPATVVLTGRGLAGAQLQLSTMSVNFGSVATGASASATIGVSNVGEAPTTAPRFSAAAPFGVGVSSCGPEIAPGASCSVQVSFSPTMLAPAMGTFTASATSGGMVTAGLSGTGVAPGALVVNPIAHTFTGTEVGTLGATQDFTFTNNGGVPITAPTVTLGGTAPSSFTIDQNGCMPPATLAASTGSCVVRVRFGPQSAGPLNAFLVGVSGANTAQAALNGSGLAPAQLRLLPTSATFPPTVVGQILTRTFTVTNVGGIASGSIFVLLGGPEASQWVDGNSNCFSLAPQTSCTFDVTYVPSLGGAHQGNVGVSASPGGMDFAPLNGTGITPAALSLVPAAGSSAAYGNVLLGDSRTMSFVVTNTGQQASGPLSLSPSGPNASQWQVATGTSSCQLGQPLAGGASCTSAVRFTASAAGGSGPKSATLTASATPGTAPTQALTANVQNPAELRVMTTAHSFGDVTVGSVSPSFSWVVTNVGDVATSALSFSNSNGTVFPLVSNTCTGTLAPMATCSVVMTFTPTAAGTASSMLTVSATTGGTVSLSVSGNGQWLVSVTPPTNPGTRVQTLDGRINCPGTCSAGYNNGTSVTFEARTNNGSGFHFERWALPNPCNSSAVGAINCVRTISGPTPVDAVFRAIDANLVFVSSTFVPANLGGATGGVAPYDARCNALATAAGINNVAGNAFRAWMSTAAAPAMTGTGARITATGGWRRLDGAVFAVSRAALQSGLVRVPIEIDEWGARVTDPNGMSAWTGTSATGAHRMGQDCAGWTSDAGTVFLDRGRVEGGPGLFTEGTGGHTCSNSATRIYCFQNTSTAAPGVSPIPTNGKVAFVSPVWAVSGGLTGADAHCNANKPAGFSSSSFTYIALLATTSASAASRLPARTTYYAPNGSLIGSSEDLKATSALNFLTRDADLNAGIWQHDTVYVSGNDSAWTGAGCSNCLATSTSNCVNWSSNSSLQNALVGRIASAGSDFFDGFGPNNQCSVARRLYCFQQ